MIRPIDIKVNAAHPELPLFEAVTYVDSPSAVFVHGVPRSCGNWAITRVYVSATYPDGSTRTIEAVYSAAGIWVATLPAPSVGGRTQNGFVISADGTTETGDAVTGYILGMGDFAVLSIAPIPNPGDVSWQVRYFDAPPTPPKKGDMAPVDGSLEFYDGTAWVPFVSLADYYTKTQTDALLNTKLDKSGGTVTGDITMDDHGGQKKINFGALYAFDGAAFIGHYGGSSRVMILLPYYQDDTTPAILALAAPNPTAGHLAALDGNGNLTDSGKAPTDFAPATNIPKTALASDVQASLDKADSALQTTGGTMTGGLIIGSSGYLKTESIYHPGDGVVELPYGKSGTLALLSDIPSVAGLAPLASPAFTGTPTAPTPTAGDNTAKVATTAFVQAAVAGATPNLDYVMRVDAETGGIYYTTPDTNA